VNGSRETLRRPSPVIDAPTEPAFRVRELRRDWERFVSSGEAGGVRAPVAASWRRSLAAGIDPSGVRLAPVAASRDEALERWEAHPLAYAAPLIRGCLAGIAHKTEHLTVVSDATGLLLRIEGDARVRSRAADSMNFTEGALWSEAGAGTNAIGAALAADRSTQIFAAEHFVEVVHAWTCAAAPVHDPETGELLGVIDLTGLRENVYPHSLAVAVTTARAVEGHLLHRLRERDERLRARHRRHVAARASRRALVSAAAPLLAVPELDAAPGRPRPPSDELRMLTDEQAALRRLATAVAQDVGPAEIFRKVAEEIAPLLGADESAVVRFQPDRTATVVAGMGPWLDVVGVGGRLELDRPLAITEVSRTGRAKRYDKHDYGTAPSPLPHYLRRAGYRSVVASPITVEGDLWGALVVATTRESLRADTEDRMENFAELARIVIATAESRAELTASRARAVAAGDEARRRIQRDLHDGAQQRLVSTIMALRTARHELGDVTGPAVELVDEALAHAERANRDLRELVRGILPVALSHGGLRAGIDALVSSIHLPVSVDVTCGRLPAALEATAYFIVAEALTNVVRHAEAGRAHVTAALEGGELRLEVRDDGVGVGVAGDGGATAGGGARSGEGSGLVGLRDRAAALNGELRVESPPGGGTVVAATLPVAASQAA
jgi:signal transduction histidine kinase